MTIYQSSLSIFILTCHIEPYLFSDIRENFFSICYNGTMNWNNIIDKNEFNKKLLHYYRNHRRILPWRENPTPYFVWISEIMLQQTRVEAVKDYFSRFITSFPTVKNLAEASEEEVLKHWEGLGYYSRARNLHKAAKILLEKYDGYFPGTKTELLTLPGIGPYTASAIASIVFGEKEAAVDGNFLRVGARLLSYEHSVKKNPGKRELEHFWNELIPSQAPGEFNQAIMDLGATICLPNGIPLCQDCPVNHFCSAYRTKRVEDFPVKDIKKPRRIEKKTLFLLREGDFFAMEQRNNKGLLAGLWQFPMVDGHLANEEVARWLNSHELFALRIEAGPVHRHIFSHVEWHMISYRIVLEPWFVMEQTEDGLQWKREEELAMLTLPTAFKPFREVILHGKF